MPSIPFPPSSSPGEKPGEGQGSLTNCLVEKEGDQISWKRTPGLTLFCNTALTTPRGFLDVNGVLYGALKDKAITVSASGVATTLTGALTGGKPVTWARNNKAVTPDVVVVTENGAFIASSTSVSGYPDGDLPGNPNCVEGLDGYFFFGFTDGKIFASDLNSTAINALSFTTAESNPDGVDRLITTGGRLYAMGKASIEVYSNRGTSPFPFGRDATIPVGLLNKWAVAGAQPGWDGQPIFVAADGTVRQLNGYEPAIISPNWVQRLIAASDHTALQARVYIARGQAIWSLTGSNFSVEYNVGTGSWARRKSYGLPTWRGGPSVWFDSDWVIGDAASTNLLKVSATEQFENNDPLVWEIESGNMFGVKANVAIFNFAMGVGSATGIDPIQIDPTVEIQWSDDGGNTWSEPLHRSLGKQGKFNGRVEIHRAAWQKGAISRQGRKWRLRVSDPVPVIFLGAEVGMR